MRSKNDHRKKREKEAKRGRWGRRGKEVGASRGRVRGGVHPSPLGFTGINLGIDGSKRPDPLYEGSADSYIGVILYYYVYSVFHSFI